MIIFFILLLIIIIYLYLIKPNNKRKDTLKDYENKYIAHRGLFNNIDIPENSLLAFKNAVDNDYGIELDLQLTSDNQLVVFHDVSLKRMTNINKKLTDLNYEELLRYNLLNTNEKIPLFKDVLKILKPSTPLIIEIKPEGRCIDTVKETIKMMKNYDGLYNIESFNPKVVYYLRKYEPNIIRGQLSYNYFKDSKNNIFIKFVLTNLLTNFLTRPDYIAYNHHDKNNLSFKLCSKLFKGECVAWTIKNDKDLIDAKKYYQQFIFDSFIPKDIKD